MRSAADPARRRPEGPVSIWARRMISLPLWSALGALWLGTAPLWALGGLLADTVTGKSRTLPRTRALTFFALYFACEILGVLAAALLWLVLCGGLLGGRRRFVLANAALQRMWSGVLFHGGRVILGFRVDVQGLDLARRGPLLLFIRHASSADTVLAAALIANPNRLLLRYVLKRELLWDPCLDIVGRRLPNAFIDRHSPRGTGEVAAIGRLALHLDASSAVLIYPEGTRFTPAKRDAAVAALRNRGQTILADIAAAYHHVMPPRLGGALALLDAAPGVDVVFVEHSGFEGLTTFARFWNGALVGRTIHVRLRRVAAASIPRQDRDRWLFEQWRDTDSWVSHMGADAKGTA